MRHHIPLGTSLLPLALLFLLFSCNNKPGTQGAWLLDDDVRFAVDETFRPIVAGTRLFACIRKRNPEEIAVEGRPGWFDKLWGSSATREAIEQDALDDAFAAWRIAQDQYRARQINLYAL